MRFDRDLDTGVPQQAGVIAVRRDGHGFEVCLIRRKASRRWGIPKGMVDPGDTHEETALNEAWEEAGLKGRLIGEALGTFSYEKWNLELVVAVYLMDVTEAYDDYAEAHFRDRTWWSLTEAATKLARHPVLPLLEGARTRLEKIRRGP
jgi:phosphohistidine phosphatase